MKLEPGVPAASAYELPTQPPLRKTAMGTKVRLALGCRGREARTGQPCLLPPAPLQLPALPLLVGAAKPAKPVPVPRQAAGHRVREAK